MLRSCFEVKIYPLFGYAHVSGRNKAGFRVQGKLLNGRPSL